MLILAGSMFYFGYLAWEYPTNLLLQRLPLAKYSAINVILWGSLLVLHAVVANFGGAVAVRFLLGVFESAVTPGFALLSEAPPLTVGHHVANAHQRPNGGRDRSKVFVVVSGSVSMDGVRSLEVLLPMPSTLELAATGPPSRLGRPSSWSMASSQLL